MTHHPTGMMNCTGPVDGDFFLQVASTFLDGRKLKPWEHYRDFAPELDGKPGRREIAEAARLRRLRSAKHLVPLTHREAMTWCIKTQMPECFTGYLLESI